ncbi:hypothetical protein [Arthrobacter sp. 92]|uniref:hypothetical protein n=1 Tax=Arthrobacter sp. 92 TaxID=3418175 RepID=UPI003D075390
MNVFQPDGTADAGKLGWPPGAPVEVLVGTAEDAPVAVGSAVADPPGDGGAAAPGVDAAEDCTEPLGDPVGDPAPGGAGGPQATSRRESPAAAMTAAPEDADLDDADRGPARAVATPATVGRAFSAGRMPASLQDG